MPVGWLARPFHRSSDATCVFLLFQMQNLDSIILFPVDRLLKTDMRGGKGDLKRPFDRSWKDYQDRYNELERQKKKAAKEAGKRERTYIAHRIFSLFPRPRLNPFCSFSFLRGRSVRIACFEFIPLSSFPPGMAFVSSLGFRPTTAGPSLVGWVGKPLSFPSSSSSSVSFRLVFVSGKTNTSLAREGSFRRCTKGSRHELGAGKQFLSRNSAITGQKIHLLQRP